MESQQDQALYRMAIKRAKFKKSLLSYILVNGFLWCIYLFTHRTNNSTPWPIWVMLIWGVGIVFKYIETYIAKDLFSTQAEYNKLKEKEPFKI